VRAIAESCLRFLEREGPAIATKCEKKKRTRQNEGIALGAGKKLSAVKKSNGMHDHPNGKKVQRGTWDTRGPSREGHPPTKKSQPWPDRAF